MSALAPGGRIGILGGGQLGRMLALAAADLGFDTHVYTPERDSPAGRVAAAVTIAAYEDASALTRFAAGCDVITSEFENVPAECALRLVETGVPVRPGPLALAVAQDRADEKRYLEGCGAAVAPWRLVDDAHPLADAVDALGLPAVLKSRRMGYDGKGQVWLRTPGDFARAAALAAQGPAILEAAVPFVREVSVVAARAADGSFAAFDVAENRHDAGILAETRLPAASSATVQADAIALTQRVMDHLDYIGVLALELFETAEGALVANEMAPRVHNTGHWTMDACVTSQFAQHIRAVAGWPLGATDRTADVVMTNLIGEDASLWRGLAAEPSARLHLYGKREIRQGRKMGHITRFRRPD